MPGKPTLLNDVESVPAVARLLEADAPIAEILEGLQQLPDDRGRLRRSKTPAPRAVRFPDRCSGRRPASRIRALRFEGAEVLLDVGERTEQALLLAAPEPTRMVRRGCTPMALRMRAASIITAQPMALSVAPVAECHESRWPPSITTSSFLSDPAISEMVLYAVRPSG